MNDLYTLAVLKGTIRKASARMQTDELITKMQKALNNVWEKQARDAIANALALVRQAETLTTLLTYFPSF